MGVAVGETVTSQGPPRLWGTSWDRRMEKGVHEADVPMLLGSVLLSGGLGAALPGFTLPQSAPITMTSTGLFSQESRDPWGQPPHVQRACVPRGLGDRTSPVEDLGQHRHQGSWPRFVFTTSV